MTAAYLTRLEDVVGRIVLDRPTTRLITWAWTGSRTLPVEWEHVIHAQFELMRTLAKVHAFEVVVPHGHCRQGVDELVDRLAQRAPFRPYRFPVRREEWAAHGGWAGHQRNARMLETARPDLLSAVIYRQSRGSTGCRDNALARGIPVITVDESLERVPES